MGLTIVECAVCAWRATCNLKFKYEGGSSLSCPEFTRDVSIGKKEDFSSIPSSNNTPSAKKPESKK